MASIMPGQDKNSTRTAPPAEPAEVIASSFAAGPGEISKRLAGVFKLLADETRLRILLLLFERDELNVRALCDLLEQSQPAVSHHLALLRSDGLIECRRQGKHNFYHILPERFEQLVDLVFHVFPGGEAVGRSPSAGKSTDRADA
jgi:DNA-binding transcriptional ArsR family regulator